MTTDSQRERADGNLVARLSRVMRATCSPWGVLTDPMYVSSATAILVVASAALKDRPLSQRLFGPDSLAAWTVVCALPAITALVIYLALGAQRRKLVQWLAGLPFEVQNMNALLNGIAQGLDVRFVGEPPPPDAINPLTEAVHGDCFAVEYNEHEPVVRLNIGVPESKFNPARSNHIRYRRAVRLIDEALVQLSVAHPIALVHVA